MLFAKSFICGRDSESKHSELDEPRFDVIEIVGCESLQYSGIRAEASDGAHAFGNVTAAAGTEGDYYFTGIQDEIGKEASPLPANKSSIELGTEIQTGLAGGTPVRGPIYTFAPAIDEFLKGHLFGDIFGRDILDFQSREIATISALASMAGVNSQLQAHFNIGFNTGLTETQMKSLLTVLKPTMPMKS